MAQLPDAYPPVYMGFVGFVRLKEGIIEGDEQFNSGSTIPYESYIIRATTANINLTQEITKPDVVDSRYDKSVYQLGPKLIDGTLEFPAIYDRPTGYDKGVFEILYRLAATRGQSGNLSRFNMEVKYAPSASLPSNQAEFLYTGCIVNTWQFSVIQGDVVSCNIGIIGLTRQFAGQLDPPARKDDVNVCTEIGDTTNGQLGTSRIVTWADARVNITGGRLPTTIKGSFIRSFEANINNDAERFYSLNKSLYAQAVAPRKRDVDGTMELIGRIPALSEMAESNEDQCNESTLLKFGFETEASGESCTGVATFGVTLPNCIFEIEEMSLGNDIFVTNVNWHSLPSAGTGVCDPLLTNIGSITFE